MLVFPNGPASWHGHKQFVGQRYSMQLNYMTTDQLARSELRREIQQLASRLASAPNDAYWALSTADAKFPKITLSTGEEVTVS